MAHRLRRVLRQLHSCIDALSDAQLLTQFVTARDEAAFAALVRRHGRMVLGVSRRVLNQVQDAEDVFQATFLVLARQAHRVVRRETVGSWLYRVAYRTALDAKAMRERRRAKEGQAGNLRAPEGSPVDVQDWRPILDEELSGLPDKYQAPLVLCDLESRSRKEAAEQLQIPEGTLSSRLAKARKLLAVRLARRGVTLTVGAIASALGQDALSAAVAGPLAAQTASIATLVINGQTATVSAPVALLMKGALKTMFLAKFKMVGVLLLVACLTLGAGSVAYHPVEAQNPAPAGKPLNVLEALRRENALLKLNVEVLLEKVRTQTAELETVKQNAKVAQARALYVRDMDLAELGIQSSAIAKKREPPLLDIAIEDYLAKLRAAIAAKNDTASHAYAASLEQHFRKLRMNLESKKARVLEQK
jgi:RNA polymerase sigma factor (sigma-70 family)